MSLNPLNELKRHLDDNSTPLPKRLCLAKNVVLTHHFPTAPKERVISEWLNKLLSRNQILGHELKSILEWLDLGHDLSGDLKTKLIQVTSQYLQRNPLEAGDLQHIVNFIESDKISTQMNAQISDYLLIVVTLLQNLKTDELSNKSLCEKLFKNLCKYYKESKKKLEFIIKFIDGENLETLFSFLDTDCRSSVLNVLQNILFPMTKKSFYINFLQTLIVKDNIDELMAEKGDNIQSVLKIMSILFTFPKGRTQSDPKFIRDFIDAFVSSYRNESQVIFAFYIMVTNSLKMDQSYMDPAMKMPPIFFQENDEKIKRNLFLNMLEILLQNEVDVSVRLTDTFGEKVSKVEIRKTFALFLQAVLMSQLKWQGKPDKITLKIIKSALLLDPILIEPKIKEILPPFMATKKSNPSTFSAYTDTLNCLLEILFKLSRGIPFVNQILPSIKLILEAGNTEQFELKQKLKETDSTCEIEKLNSKIINGNDVFPEATVALYGKLTSELMFRQNKDLLLLLQKDLEENCLMMLEEGFVSPSIITLTEILSSILSSVFDHNKMADHTVPGQIADEFWKAYQSFEEECLKKFGQCVLSLSYNPLLVKAFLKLCLSFANLKLFNLNYSHTKLTLPQSLECSELFDLSAMLTCLNKEQWLELATKVQEDDIVLVLDKLLLSKTMFIGLVSRNQEIENDESLKTHLIKRLALNTSSLEANYYSRVLFANLNSSQCKQLSKSLVKICLKQSNISILQIDSIKSNKQLLSSLVLEVIKNMTKIFENAETITKSLNKNNFDIATFVKDIDIENYFQQITLKSEEDILNYIEILRCSQIYYLEENYQLTAILVLLLLKNSCQNKKTRRNIDSVLLSIFELSPKCPDIYKIFPVDFVFSFESKLLLDLITLKVKTCNENLIIKFILELAVKKVKTDSDVVKGIVKLILKNKKKHRGTTSIDFFKDSVFQISCAILPIIAKEKKAITTSAYRSILADLQEILHKDLLESFKNIDFSNNGSILADETGNTDDSLVVSESALAALNAMGAFSLTLAKYCESTDNEEIKNLNCLWSGLGFFVENAILSIQHPNSKHQHIDSSIQLIVAILRYIKKLEGHPIFEIKDKLFFKLWNSIKARIMLIYGQQDKKKSRINEGHLENIAIILKFVCELSSVECFVDNFATDLANLASLKKPSQIIKDSNSILSAHKTSNYLWRQCLKANIIGPKCVAITKIILQSCKNLHSFIQQHYELDQGGRSENRKTTKMVENEMDDDTTFKIVEVDDTICELLKINLDTHAQAILSAKKITLDYKSLDAIFCLQHLIHYILGANNNHTNVQTSWHSFFILYESCVCVLNSLLVSREQLLEDRWSNYMQCYKALISVLCVRSTLTDQIDRCTEEKLAEIAHSVEKLTQSISKRKIQVSRIAAYTVADICYHLEKYAPARNIRLHLENSVALLIQASDSSYAMAFLKRLLAGSPGQMTVTNMYTMYKRYHKYTGNA